MKINNSNAPSLIYFTPMIGNSCQQDAKPVSSDFHLKWGFIKHVFSNLIINKMTILSNNYPVMKFIKINKALVLSFLVLIFFYSCKENMEKEHEQVDFSNIHISALYAHSNNGVWVASENQLFRMVDEMWYEYTDELPVDTINDIAWFKNHLWLATNSGVYKFSVLGKEIAFKEQYTSDNSALIDNHVNVFGVSSENTLWAGTKQGICYFDEAWINDLSPRIRFLNASSFAFRESDYFIGTYGYYLYHYYLPENVDGVSRASYMIDGFNGDLSTDTVYTIIIDDENALWFGSTEGLTKNIGGTSNLTGTFSYYLNGKDVYQVVIDNQKQVYAGTNSGLAVIKNESLSIYTTVDGMPSDTITELAIDASQNLWIGTTSGLAKLTGSQIINY